MGCRVVECKTIFHDKCCAYKLSCVWFYLHLASPLCIANTPSVFTYRYFLHRWPQLCILAVPTNDQKSDDTQKEAENCQRPIGCVVCKIDVEDGESSDIREPPDNKTDDVEDKQNKLPSDSVSKVFTGYIGMLAVENAHRRAGIGTALVQRAIRRMQQMGCQSIRLETEVTNRAAMNLYEDRLGFVREELLKKYYLNWGDAYRLRLWLNA